MPGFSSTQNSGPSVGGLSRNSITATALVGKSGSRSFIQVSKTVQANLVPLEDDADGAFAGMAQAQFGVGGQELRQVVDAPVGLSSSAGINLRRLLASQDQKSGLDVSVVLAWWWTFGMVLQAIQPLLGETMAPQPDGADRQAQVLSDGAIGLAGSGTQDDLGTVGILLGCGAGSDTALQFGALRRHQPNASNGEVWTCEQGFLVLPITTGSPPPVFQMRFNQQEGVLVPRPGRSCRCFSGG